MQRYHANGIGALLLESSHKRDNASPSLSGVSIKSSEWNRRLAFVGRLLSAPGNQDCLLSIFGGFQQGSEAMVQPCVIRDGLHPSSIFSRGTVAEESVCTFLVLDILLNCVICEFALTISWFANWSSW